MVIDKDNINLILILLVVSLGIGYAYINSDLNINGTAKIKNANWDVHWANVQVSSGSVTGTNVVTAPTISNSTTVNFSVVLPTPGDYYEFTVDAVNAGVIDAMIDTMDYKLNGATITTLPDYLLYEVTYSDGVELEQNHELKANTTETYKVKVKYRDDITLSQIPASDQTLSLSFAVTYRQATTSATEVPHPTYTYTVNLYDSNQPNNNSVQLGQALPSGITQYTSAADALAALRLATSDNNINFYLKHTINEGIVTESYVEFIVTDTMASANTGMTAGTYALRGLDTYDENASSTNYCKAAYYNSSTGECLSPYYESNKQTLVSAFGSSNCTDNSTNIYCSVSGLRARADSGGNVNAYVGYWNCYVAIDGASNCVGGGLS